MWTVATRGAGWCDHGTCFSVLRRGEGIDGRGVRPPVRRTGQDLPVAACQAPEGDRGRRRPRGAAPGSGRRGASARTRRVPHRLPVFVQPHRLSHARQAPRLVRLADAVHDGPRPDRALGQASAAGQLHHRDRHGPRRPGRPPGERAAKPSNASSRRASTSAPWPSRAATACSSSPPLAAPPRTRTSGGPASWTATPRRWTSTPACAGTAAARTSPCRPPGSPVT